MNRFNCHSLLRNCQSIKQIQQVHAQAVVQSIHSTFQPFSCSLLNSYALFRDIANALIVFREISSPDIVSITSLMSIYIQNNQPNEALAVYCDAVVSGRRSDGFSVVATLSAAGQIGNLGIGRMAHGIVYRQQFEFDSVVGNALVDMYCRNERIGTARKVFDVMYVKDSVSWSTMLHGYVKCSGLECAGEFFGKMPEKSAVSWTVMITGYVQSQQPRRALELFHMMKFEGSRPTLITIVGVLSACADIGALNLGRVIHGYTSKLDVGSDSTVYNALIDMYSKSGNIEIAFEIFQVIVDRDIYTWTSMISGFAAHGDGKRAVELFLIMKRLGVSPNEVTFLAVLLACCHAGLIDEGRKWFNEMQTSYNIRPKLQHLGCVVDLLGRAGHLMEAVNLINEVGMNPDAVIWRSLLSAGLVHGNTKLAEVAAKEIIKLEPDDDGVYVLLWNTYAASNRWEEAQDIRKRMEEQKVLKKPGCSWIEIDGHVHEFLVGGEMGNFENQVCQLLEGMAEHLKSNSTFFFSVVFCQ